MNGQDPAVAALELSLFHELRSVRSGLVKGVAPYMIFSDVALVNMAAQRPATLDTLQLVDGVNKARAEKHGPKMLACIAAFARTHALDTDVGLSALARARAAQATAPDAWRLAVTPTVAESVDMYLAGKTVEQIRVARGIAESTGAVISGA